MVHYYYYIILKWFDIQKNAHALIDQFKRFFQTSSYQMLTLVIFYYQQHKADHCLKFKMDKDPLMHKSSTDPAQNAT